MPIAFIINTAIIFLNEYSIEFVIKWDIDKNNLEITFLPRLWCRWYFLFLNINNSTLKSFIMMNPLLKYAWQLPFKTVSKTRFTVFLIIASFLYTQANVHDNSPLMEQLQVQGTVSDENGVPLPGASVVVKGTTTGTVT